MTNVGGMKFSTKLTGKTVGTNVMIACKFAFAGGLSVTKTFTYMVGNACSGTGVENVISTEPFFYPNPVKNVLKIFLPEESNRLTLFNVLGNKIFDRYISGNYKLDMSTLKEGIYFLKAENSNGYRSGKLIKN